MSAIGPSKRPLFLNPATGLVFFGITFGFLGVTWAFISHELLSILSIEWLAEPPPELAEDVREFSDSVAVYVLELFFARPWLALVTGATSGVIFGIWCNVEHLRNFESEVEKICRKAQGERVKRPWNQHIATWGQVCFLASVMALSMIWPISIKTELYSLACTAFLAQVPVNWRLHRVAQARLDATAFDESKAGRVRSWRRRQNIGVALGIVASIVITGWLSELIFFELVPQLRKAAKESEQIRLNFEHRSESGSNR